MPEEIDGIISADLPARLPPRAWRRSPRVPAATAWSPQPPEAAGTTGRGRWGQAAQASAPTELWAALGDHHAFGTSALGCEVPLGRAACISADSPATPFLLLVSMVSPLQLPALTSSHWISLREPVWVAGVSRGNTGDHESFLLICKHQAPLI